MQRKPVILCQNEVCGEIRRGKRKRSSALLTAAREKSAAFAKSKTTFMFTRSTETVTSYPVSQQPYAPATRHTALHLEKKIHMYLLSAQTANAFSFTSNRMQCWIHTPTTHYKHDRNPFQTLPHKQVTSFSFLTCWYNNSTVLLHLVYSLFFRKKYNHFIWILTVSVLTVQPNVGRHYFISLK